MSAQLIANITFTPEESASIIETLRARNLELKTTVEWLIETGKHSMNFVEGFCNNADREKPEYWHRWNGIVSSWQEGDK